MPSYNCIEWLSNKCALDIIFWGSSSVQEDTPKLEV